MREKPVKATVSDVVIDLENGGENEEKDSEHTIIALLDQDDGITDSRAKVHFKTL